MKAPCCSVERRGLSFEECLCLPDIRYTCRLACLQARLARACRCSNLHNHVPKEPGTGSEIRNGPYGAWWSTSLSCRRQYATNHTWARGVAVRTNNRQAVIDALLGYGNLRRDLGQHADARPYFESAARRAAYTGRDRQAGKAHHDLLTIAAEVGTLAQARRHVTLALDHYPIKDMQLPALTHDWAYLLVRLNHYSAAVPLLTLAGRYAPSPDQQSVIASTLSWTFGALRNQQQFEETASVVTTLLERHHFYAAAALVHIARGARALGQWERAESFANEALQIAQQREEEANAQAASELLKQIRAREFAQVDSDPPDLEAIARISRRFVSRLHNLPTPGHHQPEAGSNAPLSAGA